MSEPIEMPFVGMIRLGPRNHVLDGVYIPPWEEVILGTDCRHNEKHWESLLRCTQQKRSLIINYGTHAMQPFIKIV